MFLTAENVIFSNSCTCGLSAISSWLILKKTLFRNSFRFVWKCWNDHLRHCSRCYWRTSETWWGWLLKRNLTYFHCGGKHNCISMEPFQAATRIAECESDTFWESYTVVLEGMHRSCTQCEASRNHQLIVVEFFEALWNCLSQQLQREKYSSIKNLKPLNWLKVEPAA